MSICPVHESWRNRLLIALLPAAHTLFRWQDALYRRLGIPELPVPCQPPWVPPSEAVPYAPEHGYLPGPHGYRLFYRAWPPRGAQARAAVVAIDGIGSYAKQFHPIGTYLAPRDIAFVGLDLQGQGMSEGPRSDWSNPARLVDGVATTLHWLGERFPHRPVYLIGESAGALLALRLAARPTPPPNLGGLILASAEIDPTRLTAGGGWETIWTVLKQIPYFLIDSRAPSVDIAGREKLVARGLAVYERSLHDPLRNNCVSIRTLAAVLELIASTPMLAQRTRVPTLVLQASCDQVTRPADAAGLVACLATDDKELVYFPGAAHGLFYDPDTPEVLEVIGHWLDRHIPRWQAPADGHGLAAAER
jgi:acylglycerol lipase